MPDTPVITEEQLQRAHADPALQIAQPEGKGPDVVALKTAFETTVRDCYAYVNQCRINYETRYALWNGQAEDGKKHAREGAQTEPTPWDGASDLKVFLVDEAINAKVAMKTMALKKANLVAVPIQGNDLGRAKVVSNFMRWLVHTQIPELDRESELLANYIEEKGLAATGQFWETVQEKTLDVLKLADFQAKFPQINLQQLIEHPALEETFRNILSEFYDISKAKAKAMFKELRDEGETSIPVTGRAYSRPVIRAFNFDEDLFIPPYATDIEMAPWIFRVQYFTAERLRSFINTDEWDQDWVEAAITKCKGRMISMAPDQNLQPVTRNFVFRYQRFNDLIGVVYAYQRLSDMDGIPGIYLTVFNPDLPADEKQDGYAKHGLLGYRHGQYPFVLHRKEFLSRRLHDSRGLPEAGKPYQDQIKAHRDSRIDAASVSVLPPLMYPLGRPPAKWGPGARIPERRSGEYHYADRVMPDMSTDESEKLLTASWREYCGFITPGTDEDQGMAQLLQQSEVDKFMSGWARAFRQVWKLWQQYGDDKTTFRVIGLQKAKPEVIEKGDPTEDFDFYMTWDVQNMDKEAVQNKLGLILQIVQAADKDGQTDYGQLLQVMLESVDPNLAERIIQPKDTATQQVVNDVKNTVTQAAAGFDSDIKLGTPPDLGMQVLNQFLQSQDTQQRYTQDVNFRQRIDKLAKQFEFQKTQQQNAKIGKYGA